MSEKRVKREQCQPATPAAAPRPSPDFNPCAAHAAVCCVVAGDAAAGNPERVRMTQLDSKMASPDLMMEVVSTVPKRTPSDP